MRSQRPCLVAFAVLTIAASANAEDLRVGYRIDAKPFSNCTLEDKAACEAWALGPNARFEGFVAGICDFVFDDMNVQIKTVGVTAITRTQMLKATEPENRIDVLCDSMSVTFARSEKYLFTPLVFVSGVSYAVSRSARDREEKAFIDAMSDLVGPDGPPEAWSKLARVPLCSEMDATGAPPVFRVGVLADTTAEEAVTQAKAQQLFRLNRGGRTGERVCIERVETGYRSALEKLCAGQFSYFFGDRDLLSRHLNSIREADDKNENAEAVPCDAELSSAFFSFEPYAIAVRADRPEIFTQIQTSLFRFFIEPERVEALFHKSFGEGSRPSELVESLFRLNALGLVE